MKKNTYSLAPSFFCGIKRIKKAFLLKKKDEKKLFTQYTHFIRRYSQNKVDLGAYIGNIP